MADAPGLNHQKYTDMPSKLADLAEYLRNTLVDVDDPLEARAPEDTIEESVECQAEIDVLQDTISKMRAEIEEIWRDQHQAAFELVAVFMHRGKRSLLHVTADYFSS